MTRAAKKDHECVAVGELLKRLGIVDAEVTPRETPDFEISTAGCGRIGIEVAELADRQLAEGEAALKHLRVELRKELEARGVARGVHLSVGEGATLFSPRDVRTRHVKAIVKLLAEFGSTRGSGAITFKRNTLVRSGIDFVLSLIVSDTGMVTTGSHANGRRHPFVQSCIDAKNAKIGEYRAALSAGQPLWLLLLTGVDFRSGIWSVVVEDHEYVSAFDRVFCIDAYENKFIEVKTRLAASASIAPPAGAGLVPDEAPHADG